MSDPSSSPASISDRRDRICIIGAGPAGLSIARALKRLGLPYDQYERHSDLGGLWDPSNPGTPVYRNAHFISSRNTSGFFDYPMPKEFPDYPHNRDILAYTRMFARSFGLRDAIRFNTPVAKVEQDGALWRVQLGDGQVLHYRAVVCCSGTNWDPNLPRHPGEFSGEIRHSVTYKDPAEFRGKRVLIVGAGNSGADIACDAAANAERAFISMRRGYHIIPKHLFGMPVDEFAEKGPALPMWLERPVFGLLLRWFVGDTSRWGLPKPDHRLFESHPLLNTQLLHYLQHGDIRVKGDIERFDGQDVVFKDGSREPIDLVLYATGYNMSMPYLAQDYFEWHGGRPELYLRTFNRKHHNLFALGLLETNSSAYTLFDRISHLLAHYLLDEVRNPQRAAAFEQLIRDDHTDLGGGLKFVNSNRHQGYIEIHAFRKHLEKVRKQIGWEPLEPGYFKPIEVAPAQLPPPAVAA
ncbi:flavin-containing monooxygenase [Solimonas flava]|uniref:flavin-containing monooxygenase n=1 Tax=Solimonas flava TaxID=415849 RepID=UPI00040B6589|nr:NAD(P)-binding domain-containing protein [Solimonas flava]